MLDKLSRFKISNTDFFNGEVLNLFDSGSSDKVIRASLVFGKNGSGKSTIINLLNNFKTSDNSSNNYIEFLDDNDEILNEIIPKENIHCFGESFIDNNVKVLEDGLKTIIMLGEQVDVDEKIKDTFEKMQTAKEKLSQIELAKYKDDSSTDSPDFYYEKIRNALNQPNGWAEMDRDVKGNKGKSKVTDDIIKKIPSYANNHKITTLTSSFNEKLNYYSKVRDKANLFDENIKEIDVKDEFSQVEEHLFRSVTKPIGDQYSERLTMMVQKHGTSRLDEIRKTFETDLDYCPYCLRNISSNEIKVVIDAINIVQNRDVKEYEEQLRKIKINEVDIGVYNQYREVSESLVDKIQKNVNSLNVLILKVNKMVDNRIQDIFTVPNSEKLDYITLAENINRDIQLLSTKVKEFNKDVNDSKKLKDDLTKLAMQIAYHSIKNDLSMMDTKKIDYETATEQANTLMREITEFEDNIKTLESRKSRTDIAQELINEFLTMIFYDESRLKIIDDNGKYIVYSFNKPVPPNRLSTGERNAIALCYFFTTINNNSDKISAFKKPLLIGIDAPVTSFDIDNRIGIFSFLRSMFYKILSGNDQSKVLVLTHKIDVFYDLGKTLNDSFLVSDKYIKSFELKNKSLVNFNIQSTYKCLLREVYEFASKETLLDSDIQSIGNIMRRVVESFAHFNYALDINKITNEERILEKIQDSRLRDYFRDFMHRLILNNESHMRDIVSSMETNAYYQYVNVDEKKKTAKALLVFLYHLDEFHVIQNLKGLASVDKSLKQWSNELRSQK